MNMATELSWLRTMLVIRAFEERILSLHGEGSLPGFMHVSVGQEAVPVGVSEAMRAEDRVFTTHRGHGDAIARGMSLRRMFAELLGLSDGVCSGRGGSMHVADIAQGIMGANGIVGAGLPLAAGSALASVQLGEDVVVVCYIGDGAIANGVAHETLNMARLHDLPLVIVRVNNGYAESTPVSRYLAITDLAAFVASYGVAYREVDGNDVGEVASAAHDAVVEARSGSPSVLECLTYRWYGHNIGDPGNYRPQEEVDEWKARDPVVLLTQRLLKNGDLTQDDVSALTDEVSAEIDENLAMALLSHTPDPTELYDYTYATSGLRTETRWNQ